MQELSTAPDPMPAESNAGPPLRRSIVHRFVRALGRVARSRRLLFLTLLLIVAATVILAITPNSRMEADLRKARQAVERSRYAAAAPFLAAVLERRPDHAEALLLAARAARRLSAFDDAHEFLLRFERAHGIDERLILERALLRAERGDLDAVREYCLARIEQGHAETAAILEALTHGALRTHQLAEARELLRVWAGHNADDPRPHFLRGMLAELSMVAGDAAGAYRRALDLVPDWNEPCLRLSRLLLSQNRADEALPHLAQLRRQLPDDTDVKVDHAVCLDMLGQSAEAERLLDEVLAAVPRHPQGLLERGRLANRRNDPRAEALLREAVA